ncbi:MAG: hypothetical protein WC453_01235 [Patescibacteria group bacterium]
MKIENIIANWPKLFLEALTEKRDNNLIKILSSANKYWWLAYNIYDDILDGDSDAFQLPIANNYFIKFISSYYKLNLPKQFYQIFEKTITNVEKANKLELKQQKLKFNDGKIIIPQILPGFTDLKMLSKKSLALSLGPIAIAYYLNLGQRKVNLCIEFFKNFLAAKQLSDDAHDWLEDLQSGKITAANSLILKEARTNKIVLDLNNQQSLFKLFLKINSTTGKNVIKLCKQANKLALRIGLQKNCKFLNITIIPIQNAANRALKINN